MHDVTQHRPEPPAPGPDRHDRYEVPAGPAPRDGALSVAPSQPAPQWIVLEVAGGLDLAGAPRLRVALNQAITAVAGDAARADLAPTATTPTGAAPRRARVCCDLNSVGFLSVTGIAVLLEATAAAEANDVDLTVRAHHPAVLRALAITDTTRHLRWETERPSPTIGPGQAFAETA